MSKERPKRAVKLENQEAPVEELTGREAEQVQGGYSWGVAQTATGITARKPGQGVVSDNMVTFDEHHS